LPSESGRIGVIGTVGTINSSEYVKALHSETNESLHVVTKACPLFVLLVENNLVDTPEAQKKWLTSISTPWLKKRLIPSS
jgi:glutamate racemase